MTLGGWTLKSDERGHFAEWTDFPRDELGERDAEDLPSIRLVGTVLELNDPQQYYPAGEYKIPTSVICELVRLDLVELEKARAARGR